MTASIDVSHAPIAVSSAKLHISDSISRRKKAVDEDVKE